MTVGFPLLLLPLAICNIIAFLMPDVSLTANIGSLLLPSGARWQISIADALIALAALLLLLELIKASRPGSRYFTDHLLSLTVAGVGAAEFAMLPQFGNSTFFILTLMAIVDFFAGFAFRIRRYRRVVQPVEAPVAAPAPVAPASAPAAAPAPAPAPVTPAPVVVTPPPPVPAPATAPTVTVTPPAAPAAPVAAPSIEPVIVPPRKEVVADASSDDADIASVLAPGHKDAKDTKAEEKSDGHIPPPVRLG